MHHVIGSDKMILPAPTLSALKELLAYVYGRQTSDRLIISRKRSGFLISYRYCVPPGSVLKLIRGSSSKPSRAASRGKLRERVSVSRLNHHRIKRFAFNGTFAGSATSRSGITPLEVTKHLLQTRLDSL